MHPVHPHPQKGLRQHRTMKAAALCEQIALVPLCGIAVTSKKKGMKGNETTKESSRTAAAPCSSNAYGLLWRDAWRGSHGTLQSN